MATEFEDKNSGAIIIKKSPEMRKYEELLKLVKAQRRELYILKLRVEKLEGNK